MSITRGTLAKKLVTATAVDKIINCTSETMFVYGTSGVLIELPPREFDLSKVNFDGEGTFYILDKATEEKLVQMNEQFAKMIVRANYYGNGQRGESIYKFSLNKENVIPITDHYGRNGDRVYR